VDTLTGLQKIHRARGEELGKVCNDRRARRGRPGL
jgi:hypothetical protein